MEEEDQFNHDAYRYLLHTGPKHTATLRKPHTRRVIRHHLFAINRHLIVTKKALIQP
jgi:hypothetical protein